MSKKKYNSYNVIISFLSLLIIGGCTVEQTYKTLVFFFDGVPPLNSNTNTQQISTAKNITASLEQNTTSQPEQPKMNLHKPYFDRKCDLCHTPNRQLIEPMPGLCYRCHKSFNETYKYVHAPIQAGYCTKCHNQHLAELPKLLLREGQDLCLFCHTNSMNKNSKYHNNIQDASCTVCHNPHGGNTKNFLRDNQLADFNGFGALNNYLSRRLYARMYVITPGDIPAGKEVFIQDNDKNFEVINIEKINQDGRFFVDKIKKSGNYTIRLKGEEYDSIKLEMINYKDEVLCDFGYSKKNKFTYNDSLYRILHSSLAVLPIKTSDAVIINNENTKKKDSVFNNQVVINNNQPQEKEFAVEFIEELNGEERQIEMKNCNTVFDRLYANKSTKAFIFVTINGNSISNYKAKEKGKDIRDFFREKGIRRNRIILAEYTRVSTPKDEKQNSLKITIIVK